MIALAGDPALGRNSRWYGERLFADADPRYDELSSLTDDKDANSAAVAAAAKKYPQLASWVEARGYWQNRSPGNLQSLLALMLSPTDPALRAQISQPLQQEMVGGPLALLEARVEQARQAHLPDEARAQVKHALNELKHLTEGARHRSRERALGLLAQLDESYQTLISTGKGADTVSRLTQALIDTGIEGLRGWGAAPGYVMVSDGKLASATCSSGRSRREAGS